MQPMRELSLVGTQFRDIQKERIKQKKLKVSTVDIEMKQTRLIKYKNSQLSLYNIYLLLSNCSIYNTVYVLVFPFLVQSLLTMLVQSLRHVQ